MAIDGLDRDILQLFADAPTTSVLEASRRLGRARGTIQARLDKLAARGVISDFAPTIDPAALGYPVAAHAEVQIRQGSGWSAVVDHLAAIPEVVEVHTVTGDADLLVVLAARSNDDLQRVIDAVVADDTVLRVSSTIVLATPLARRTGPLVNAAAQDAP